MRITLSRLALAVLVVMTAGLMSARAAILTDPFTDGNKVGGTDNSGIAWYRRSSNNTLAVVNDTGGLGAGNALSLLRSTNDNTSTPRGIIGVFTGGAFELANVGDSLDLTFDFRLQNYLTVTTPSNNAAGFTFGLYNSNGSTVVDDATASSDNDFGYRADIGTGTISAISLNKEANVGTGGIGTTTGGDTTVLTLDPGSSAVNISNFANHSAQFRLTRTASGIDVFVAVDGVTRATSSDNSSPYFIFDEVVMSQTGNSFLIDNVVVTYTAIPEPGTLALALGGFAGLCFVRRRK